MEPNLTLFWNPCGRRHTVAVSRNLARGGLTVLAVDIDVDVDIGASGGGPGHPTLAVHPALAGKAHDQRGHDGRNPDHDRGDGRNDDRHRFGLRRRGAEQSAGHESGGQTDSPAAACVIAHGAILSLSRLTAGLACTIPAAHGVPPILWTSRRSTCRAHGWHA